ncbi:MAG: Uma2 family endonuclease [Hormoscilla sp. GUM202]|nr:Uma2 family endonuclease [Hormoscilla sp. GUM202]
MNLAKWSVSDYHRMIAAGIVSDRRLELIAGDIVEMSPEGPLHSSRIRKGANYLRRIFNDLALVSEAHPITLSNSEPEPDIAIVRLPESRYDDRHPAPDDIFWLIEIADSTLHKDLNEKKHLYARSGINEYWVMDVNSNLLTVFREPIGDDYAFQQDYDRGEIASLAFPDIIVSVTQLFS